MNRWVFEGVEYATRGEMCAARRRRYVEHLEAGMNFTQAARAVGVSKRTGKVWRNGRTRSNGRNEKPSVDWYRSTVDIPQKISSRYLSQDERISIADWRKAGMSVRGIARTHSRKPRFREPMIMISERPAEVEDRAIPGHWEGDLICSAANKSAIGTLVERSTRFTILLHLPDGHDAKHVQQAVIRKMQYLPKLLRNSLTWDQGSELALHKRISTTLDMQVYFRDPHSPWQRGTNENTNGLLRQYFPKGTDLSAYPEDHLDAVAEELNDRPRKTLGYRKPSEKILELINTA